MAARDARFAANGCVRNHCDSFRRPCAARVRARAHASAGAASDGGLPVRAPARAPASRRVVEDDPERMALPGAHAAHAVPKIHAIDTARALHRAMMDGEHDRVALLERHDIGARLHARPLLGDHEFAAREIGARLREQNRRLQREYVLAIQILMQAVVVAFAIAQQQRCRTQLSGCAATLDEVRVLGGKPRVDAHLRMPAVRDRREVRVQRGAQRVDRARQRVAEILVFAAAEPVACHRHATSEQRVARVERGERFARARREQPMHDRMAVALEIPFDRRPRQRVDPPRERGFARRAARRFIVRAGGRHAWFGQRIHRRFLAASWGIEAASLAGRAKRCTPDLALQFGRALCFARCLARGPSRRHARQVSAWKAQ
ncbi:hypothetical protein BURPS1710b_A0614 [Burkholderia pseudomallei 1710b]|uniref:Uncharacterized protein n=1 Tax=Burkholderia pseudomallei (strain 1710b) TaxID=320372 RepID=Q3JKY0_BURP1|nr:hypothetical protein BURPS1710b_A0614 [Burkholderia pseudomallei 1710b]